MVRSHGGSSNSSGGTLSYAQKRIMIILSLIAIGIGLCLCGCYCGRLYFRSKRPQEIEEAQPENDENTIQNTTTNQNTSSQLPYNIRQTDNQIPLGYSYQSNMFTSTGSNIQAEILNTADTITAAHSVGPNLPYTLTPPIHTTSGNIAGGVQAVIDNTSITASNQNTSVWITPPPTANENVQLPSMQYPLSTSVPLSEKLPPPSYADATSFPTHKLE